MAVADGPPVKYTWFSKKLVSPMLLSMGCATALEIGATATQTSNAAVDRSEVKQEIVFFMISSF